MGLTQVSTKGIKDATILDEDIAVGTITAARLGNDCVGTAELQNSAVETVNIQDQAVDLTKLPHGTSSNDGKFLRANNGADPSFETVTSTTINNNADNRLITGSGTANTLEGESGLIYNSNELTVTEQITVDSPDNVTSIGGDYALKLLGGDAINDIVNLRFATGADGSLAQVSAIAEATGSYPNSSGALLLCVQSGGAVYEALRINSARKISTGAETAPDVGTGGLCIQKGTDSNKALTIKNTNIAHGVTTYDETDTYFSIGQVSGNKGGVEIRGYTDAAGGDPAIRLRGIIASDSDQTYTPLVFVGAEANGTGVQNIAADRRIATFQNSDGARIVNITGTGISFGDNYAAANALDYYEEGTFSPTFGASNGSSTTTYTTQQGAYTKIGNTVFFNVYIRINSISTNTHSVIVIGALPFQNAGNRVSIHSIRSSGFQSSGDDSRPFAGTVEASNTKIELVKAVNGGTSDFTTSVTQSGVQVYIAGQYPVS